MYIPPDMVKYEPAVFTFEVLQFPAAVKTILFIISKADPLEAAKVCQTPLLTGVPHILVTRTCM